MPRHQISQELRAKVIARDDHTCQMCGIVEGDPHSDDGGRKARLRVGYFVVPSQVGTADIWNLRALCSVCHEGVTSSAAILLPRPNGIQLLTQIRRAPQEAQLVALAWLKGKFEP